MEKIIERLKKEKNESLKEWFEIGKGKGQEWAKEAHYDELQMVVNGEHEKVPMEKLIEFESGNHGWFNEEIYDVYPIVRGTEPDATVQAGFMEGVREFWNEIQGKI
jgi:hypothetical protein